MAAALRQIAMLNGRLGAQGLTRMMNYDPERLVSPIHKPKAGTDDQRTPGLQGLGLKQMASYGHNVPEGFVISTELFMAMPAMSYRPLYDDAVQRIRKALGRLERQTGLRLGDPPAPLLLSIRSGAAISMPGLMTTFVNVGLNDASAEAWPSRVSMGRLGRLPALPAVVGHVGRHRPRLLRRHHRPSTRAATGSSRSSISLPSRCARSPSPTRRAPARRAWSSSTTPSTRSSPASSRSSSRGIRRPPASTAQYIGVAEEWGTAVVVQRMVFGNLSRESGSGVTFTHNPLEPYSRQVRLFGDFAVRSQGEDLVGGLVFPLPISEAQRLGSPTYRGVERSLERDYPEVYEKLLSVARELVGEREYDPQEIEFTFESPAAEDLYVLQKRAVVQQPRPRRRPTSTRRRPASGHPWRSGWACPEAPTQGAWRSTPRRSTNCWPRSQPRTSCCCVPTRCPRTSP